MMRVSRLKVKGFRCLEAVDMPLFNYTILIGRNNSGKSAVLLALKLLFEGTARDLTDNDFYTDGTQQADQIVIEADLEGVREYLELCHESHRTKISNCIFDGDKLRIRRTASRSSLELGKIELWQPNEGKFGLPTGIENALKQLLPEIIFIEAFRDPTEEARAKSSATLGKLLKQIVEPVSTQLEADVRGSFDQVARRFNVVEKGKDKRPAELRRIEQRIRQHMQTVFEEADVRLKFRLPEVSDLMGSATVELKDRGIWTPPEGKGQGFQRILYLALLQALAEELRERATGSNISRPFLLLFEEPEAFLHPALQREMGNVLESISASNQIVVTTHSPLFVTPENINNVLILRQDTSAGTNRYATRYLSPAETAAQSFLSDKQIGKLLSLSNSTEFLFADRVLVVEGPSDRALLEASWDVLRKSLYPKGQPLVLAFVEAGDKIQVPDLVKYLREIGFSAYGVVDLDFLWRGARKCLQHDRCYSQFMGKFQPLAEREEIAKKVGEELHIPSGKKKQVAFSLIRKRKELKEQAEILRQRLLEEHGIWVLAKGELDSYFCLSTSSKGQYLTASQNVRDGKVSIRSEIKDILKWATSSKKGGAG